MNHDTKSPMLAEKIATTVIQPRMFVQRPFTRSPMIARLFVINRIKSRSGGVEKPWTMPDQTRAFIGLNPRKLRPPWRACCFSGGFKDAGSERIFPNAGSRSEDPDPERREAMPLLQRTLGSPVAVVDRCRACRRSPAD